MRRVFLHQGIKRILDNLPNFNSLTQTYVLDEEAAETMTFASDFSTFTCPECSLWVKQ